jgi:hypothetical protein
MSLYVYFMRIYMSVLGAPPALCALWGSLLCEHALCICKPMLHKNKLKLKNELTL